MLDELTTYMIIGTVVGARLGHCLFYEPSYYLQHPFKILMVWEGGLASHGAGNRPSFDHYPFLPCQKIFISLGDGQGCHRGRFVRLTYPDGEPDEFRNLRYSYNPSLGFLLSTFIQSCRGA